MWKIHETESNEMTAGVQARLKDKVYAQLLASKIDVREHCTPNPVLDQSPTSMAL